jgi:hypothetical protein
MMRPDGRVTTPQTRTLRTATRALRCHLDTLPVDLAVNVPGDRFLARLAFTFARQRYDCAESMIGAGFGGTVLGSIARRLLVDGLRWLWIGEQPQRRRALLGDLLEEGNRIWVALDMAKASCPILARWLMPLSDIADLTGQSLTWLDAPSMPSEDQLHPGRTPAHRAVQQRHVVRQQTQPEMQALALDVACLGSAHMLRLVHNAAGVVHGLD